MGLPDIKPPKASYIASAILSAYNIIARSRTYFESIPKPLDADAILSYRQCYEIPCEAYIFNDCIFALDNLFIDEAHKKAEQRRLEMQMK